MIAQGGDRWLGQIHGAPAAQTIARTTGYTVSRAGWRLVAGGGRREYVPVGLAIASLLSTPPPTTNRHPALSPRADA